MEKLPEIAERAVRFPGANGEPVTGFLAAPASASPQAGVLFLHWGFGDATSFLAEARAYVGAGAAALSIDAPGYGARKGPRVGSRDLAHVRAYAEQLLGDLAGAIDFLCERPGVDASRLGYVGHSLGATIAGAFLAREPRIKAAVLMAGTGTLSRLWLQRRDPEAVRSLEDLDGVQCLARVTASLFFQFADRDEWISRADADAQLTAAREPKQAKWYACDHALDAAAFRDRASFLTAQLGLAREPEPPAGHTLPRRQVRLARAIGTLMRWNRWLKRPRRSANTEK